MRGIILLAGLLSWGQFLLPVLSAAHGAEAQVRIDNFTFSPAEIGVPAGTQITWTNHDDIPHTVTSNESQRLLKSPPLDTGESFSYIFNKPGTYRYFCSLHPHMQGTILVN